VIDPQARAFLREGASYTDRARLEEARVALEVARQRSSVEGDADCFFDATLALARVHNSRYCNERVLGLTDELLMSSHYSDNSRLMRASLRRAFSLTDIGRAQDALDLLTSAAKRTEAFARRDLHEFLLARVYAETRLGLLSPALYNSNLATTFDVPAEDIQIFHHNMAMALGESGLLREALSHSDRALAAVRGSSRSAWVAHVNASRAWLLLQGGRLEEARSYLDIALLERTLTPVTFGRRGAVAAMLAHLTKDKKLESASDEAFEWVTSGGAEDYRLGPMAVGCHALFVARGLMNEARTLRERILSNLRCVFGMWWFLYEVVAHGDRDEREYATALLSGSSDAQPMARGFRCMASAVEARRAGRVRESIALAREAEAIFSGSGMALHAATAMRLSGRRRQADELLRQCQARIRGSELGRHDPGKGDPRLTKRQNEVAQLASAGLGNAKIAESLGITQSTVEQHLAAARARLNVRNRAEFRQALDLSQP